MAFEYLTNVPLEEAREKYLSALRQAGLTYKTETIPTTAALGRVTANAVYARISSPHYNACAMDGIALQAKRSFGASETTPAHLKADEFVWVNTGDPLPEGCDAVVMVEDVVEEDGGVTLYAAALPWQHVRQIGEDISAGDMIVPSFSVLSPSALGALLESGVLRVEVVTRPTAGIIPTGNELVAPTEEPKAGSIIESNSTLFAGMLETWGCNPRIYPGARDDPDQIEQALRRALAECDLVVLNAGSSAGRKDFSTDAIRKVGEVVLHGVAIKPGKPAILAHARPEGRGLIPVLGLPGYPVSGILVMEELFRPVVDSLTCLPSQPVDFTQAVISRRLTSSLKYLEFVRTRLGNVNGKTVAVPLNRGAGVVTSFVKADGIIYIPQNTEGYEAGEMVNVRLTRSRADIDRTLVITGSHDPLLDEVADILKREDRASSVASSHVGSLSGIMAVRRGEAHLGGIHLLDEASGTYNIPFLRRYFPTGGVVLVECVQRTQGLIVPKGNPQGIRGFSDIADKRYVNRQKGSGTRILCDFLTRQNAMDPQAIQGYDREEYTHTAVAAAIAAGTADAGLGIYSAARIFDLDFVPVCEEQYDLIIAENAFHLDMVQRLLEVLRGVEFARRLKAMGGYTLIHPGEIRPWN
ncbi:MAG: molybdopterin biosynthesis protein [Chloroflexi bacterium]|jgi:putative molybdopterin biosynthesis protein|nr:molybdopterin biosynthesis protein [Anaerolineaceae bacterium]NLI44470.1 molybdopterin biosynthesis protein [Chloroflexota bacterium]HOE35543.1 molybdopterin biosynthesis protein [Anaerolineaceae bacterium]HOT26429.1 molybdopterin biosynthesis protein [Anaerolineaceae bacterium]HQK04282.1 molybdopterin biosynthesis protein [Anaerolineaceae bacterium]